MENANDQQEQRKMTPVFRLAELGKTSGGLIHDLVNQVTAATLSMNYMERRLNKDSELLREYAQQSARTRKSIEKFAASARSYIRNEKNEERLNLKNEIKSAVQSFGAVVNKKNVKIFVGGKESIYVQGNKFKLNQIIHNLISNAIYACRKNGGEIEISCSKRKDGASLVVEDNGCGVPDKIKDKIFEPFFTTKNQNGSGLGLASIKKIIEEDFRGKIILKTKNGTKSGAIFVVLFGKNVREPS